MRRKKITIVGAGNTGSQTALLLAAKGLGDIVLIGSPDSLNKTKGKALDMLQATALLGSDIHVKGTSSYCDTADSDLVIITAGAARKPGMSRDDLVDVNLAIVTSVVEEVVKYSPEATLLILTNPVDIMTYVAQKVSGFPRNRVIGQAGVLDTARFRTFIAQELSVSVNDVTAWVLGIHGDEMVPLSRYAFVGGVPLEQCIAQDRLQEIIQRTRKGGAEIVNLLGNGSAYFAPSASLMQMAQSILLDEKRMMTGVAILEGEYGYHDLVMGVPMILGANGIERIIEFSLLPEEKDALLQSARAVRSGMERISDSQLRKLA